MTTKPDISGYRLILSGDKTVTRGGSNAAFYNCQPHVMMLRWSENWEERRVQSQSWSVNLRERSCLKCHLPSQTVQENQLAILELSFIVAAFILIFSFLLGFERVFPSLDGVPTRELVETQPWLSHCPVGRKFGEGPLRYLHFNRKASRNRC